MLSLLAAGATIYQIVCPELIKENTETRWKRELNQPLIEYRSAMYHRIWLRHLCFAFYVVGGSYTLAYLAWRAFGAVRFLLSW